MPNSIQIKTYTDLPDFDRTEILRYAGYLAAADEATSAILDECLQEAKTAFSFRVAYRTLAIEDFLTEFKPDESLQAMRLSGVDRVVLFAATVGLGIDRLTAKYANVSTVKALFFQAIGAERVESLCNRFCEELTETYAKQGVCTRQRFSPGYGAFPLTAQNTVFKLLDCPRTVGISLQDSLLMSPTKSVTAVVGLAKTEK